MITLWKASSLSVLSRRMVNRSILIKGYLLGGNIELCITNLYSPNQETERENLWTELEDIRIWGSVIWCIGGDFNVIRYSSERRGRVVYTRGMELFSDFIERNNLIDSPLIGGRFTWLNEHSRPAMSRLDRFVASLE